MPEQDQKPLVSIIMPTYNRAGLITETIESVRKQTYSNWELIIVDDGSNDNTEDVIGNIKDERISFIKAGRIGIVGKIKNIGLGKANGELIAFNDSDDLWDKSKLEKQVAALQEYGEAGFCLTGGYNFKETGRPFDHFYKQSSGVRVDNVFTSIFKSEIAVFTQALMIRRICLDVAGLFKEEKSFSDFNFIVSLAKKFKAVILYEPLVFRRLHDDNYIKSTWEKSYYEGEAIIRENKTDLPVAIYNDAMFRLYTNFGERCLQHNEKTKAIAKFLTAWQYKPFSFIPPKKTIKALSRLFKTK
jgi:glycosyltransferase involved in cell wall biosynthesis